MNQAIFFFFYNLTGAHEAAGVLAYNWVGSLALVVSYPFFYGSVFLLFAWVVFSKWKDKFNFSVLFSSAASAWVLGGILKVIFHIERPFIALHITPLFPESGFSFPSEHAAVYSAIAVAMFAIDKRAGWVFSVLALLVGVSRIVIGVHYPLDILGGFALGALMGYLFTKLTRSFFNRDSKKLQS